MSGVVKTFNKSQLTVTVAILGAFGCMASCMGSMPGLQSR
jgi:hypothetical protein